jgi:hypothetical protein
MPVAFTHGSAQLAPARTRKTEVRGGFLAAREYPVVVSFLAPEASECRGSAQSFLAPEASECRGSVQTEAERAPTCVPPRGSSGGAVFRLCGLAAARRALPIFGLVLVVATPLFGPHALRPSDVTRLARGSALLRLGLLGFWLTFAGPIARILLDAPALRLLLPLPVARWRFLLAQLGLLLLAQAPWIALFLIGDGWLAGLAWGLSAVALQALAVARPRRPVELASLAAVGAAVWGGLAGIGLVVVGGAAAWVGLDAAWARMSERGGGQRPGRLPRRPLRALVWLLACMLWRGGRTRLVAVLALLLLTGEAAALAARNNALAVPEPLFTTTLAISAAPLTMSGVALARTVVERARRLQPLLLPAGAPARLPIVAEALLCAGLGLAAGGLVGGLASRGAAGGIGIRLGLGLLCAGWGALQGGLTALAARWAYRDQAHDALRSLLVVVLGSALAIAAALAAGNALQ